MTTDALAQTALELAAESAGKLQRWLVLFEARLAEAEQTGQPNELREFTAFLAAVKRTLEIARIAAILSPGGTAPPVINPDDLRKLLLEED